MALDQVKVNGSPAVTLLKTELVNRAALAKPVKAAAARRTVVNCMLTVVEMETVLGAGSRISPPESNSSATRRAGGEMRGHKAIYSLLERMYCIVLNVSILSERLGPFCFKANLMNEVERERWLY